MYNHYTYTLEVSTVCNSKVVHTFTKVCRYPNALILSYPNTDQYHTIAFNYLAHYNKI